MAYRNEVAAALDILLEEIEATIEALNQELAERVKKGDHDQAQDLMEKWSQMREFRQKVSDLGKEWDNLFASVAVRTRRRKGRRKTTKRLGRGLRTREDVFRVPILRSLVELGGSGSVADVLDKVGELMRDRLNEYDRSPIASYPSSERWRNTAQWARSAMVKEGLLASDCPRGTWRITGEGKRWLAAPGETGMSK